MGVSIYPDNATDIDTLMQQADAAMYRARQMGRCTTASLADMNRLAEQRLVYSAALCQTTASDGLTLHYQPQTRTIGGVLDRVEALARWPAPVLGEVSPLKFIPLTEECGLIEQIGLWAISEACRQMAAWLRPDSTSPASRSIFRRSISRGRVGRRSSRRPTLSDPIQSSRHRAAIRADPLTPPHH
jgi:predicted signal transduction protein with EAL and GGDEF domain